jgi:hypothetical protein
MAEKEPEFPVTEPVTVNDVFVTAVVTEITDNYVRIIGYSKLQRPSGEMNENRIVERMVLPDPVARELLTQLRKGLARRGTDGH